MLDFRATKQFLSHKQETYKETIYSSVQNFNTELRNFSSMVLIHVYKKRVIKHIATSEVNMILLSSIFFPGTSIGFVYIVIV